MPNIFRVIGKLIARGDGATDALEVQNSSGTTKLSVADAGRVTLTQDTTVGTQVVSVLTTSTTNAGLVLQPNGTGAIMAQAPDGTGAGGNARGQYAVDLQTVRGNAARVASGNNSIALGDNNTASSTGGIAIGSFNTSSGGAGACSIGGGNTSSGVSSIAASYLSTASGDYTGIIGGNANTASGTASGIIGGELARTYLYNQVGTAGGRFAANSDAQRSTISLRREITGVAAQELFLNGSSLRAILSIASPGPTNARAWRAQVDVVAIVATAGGGGLVINECFMGSYVAGIKRVGTNTSLVGAVATVNEVSDTNMATSVVTIDADDTNEALRIQFTPPSTADGSTVIRVVATAYLTEVGR